MGVGIKVGSVINEIGSPDFFHAFFSTVSANLEKQWGERFPMLHNRLYQGELSGADAAAALVELTTVRGELASLPVGLVVWDIEDRQKTPPWGDTISPEITDLSNYFVTSTGRDLIATLAEALEELRDKGGAAQIVATPAWSGSTSGSVRFS